MFMYNNMLGFWLHVDTIFVSIVFRMTDQALINQGDSKCHLLQVRKEEKMAAPAAVICIVIAHLHNNEALWRFSLCK